MTPRRRRALLAIVAAALMAGEAVWLLSPPPPPAILDFVIAPTGLVAVLEPEDVTDMPDFDPASGRWVHGGEILISLRSHAWLGHIPTRTGSPGRYAYVVARLGRHADAQMLHRALASIAGANLCHAGIYDPDGKQHDGKPEVFIYRIVSTRAPDGRVVPCHETLDGLRVPKPRPATKAAVAPAKDQRRAMASSPSR